MLEKIKINQETFNACDTIIKLIGIIALIISGIFALNQFNESIEREYKKSFYEKQLNVINSVFDVMYELDIAESEADKNKSLKKFWIIYQGTGRTFLSSRMFEALNRMPTDYVTGCVAHLREPKFISNCENYTAIMSISNFSQVAREEISEIWKQDFSRIGKEDPWVPMNFQKR